MNMFPVDDRRSRSEQIADEAALLITCLRGLPFTVPHDMDAGGERSSAARIRSAAAVRLPDSRL
jgi:hypothetical protein